MLFYPGGSIRAEFFSVGFIQGSKEFEDCICGSIAFGFAEACEFGFEVISQQGAVLPNFFNEIGWKVVNEPESFGNDFGLCHGERI